MPASWPGGDGLSQDGRTDPVAGHSRRAETRVNRLWRLDPHNSSRVGALGGLPLGVCAATVTSWRMLGVPRNTKGSLRLSIDYAAEVLTPEVRAKAKLAMGSPETRAKLRYQQAGQADTPQHGRSATRGGPAAQVRRMEAKAFRADAADVAAPGTAWLACTPYLDGRRKRSDWHAERRGHRKAAERDGDGRL